MPFLVIHPTTGFILMSIPEIKMMGVIEKKFFVFQEHSDPAIVGRVSNPYPDQKVDLSVLSDEEKADVKNPKKMITISAPIIDKTIEEKRNEDNGNYCRI